MIPPAAENDLVSRVFYTTYGSALFGRKLKLSDHSQNHSKADKELARWNKIIKRLVKKSMSPCDRRPANHFFSVSVLDKGSWPDFSLLFTTGDFIFLRSRISFVRNISLSPLFLLTVCVVVGTVRFYELMQFLQSAFNMCKSLASRRLAKQTMRFILGLDYTTVN
jgi:hypothetical protein